MLTKQKRVVAEYCERHKIRGYFIPPEVCDADRPFADRRLGAALLKEELKPGDQLLIPWFDRGFRCPDAFFDTLAMCKERGVRLHFARENAVATGAALLEALAELREPASTNRSPLAGNGHNGTQMNQIERRGFDERRARP